MTKQVANVIIYASVTVIPALIGLLAIETVNAFSSGNCSYGFIYLSCSYEDPVGGMSWFLFLAIWIIALFVLSIANRQKKKIDRTEAIANIIDERARGGHNIEEFISVKATKTSYFKARCTKCNQFIWIDIKGKVINEQLDNHCAASL